MTKWIDRFIAALTLLCGEAPPLGMAQSWANHETEDLQDWALNHCSLPWCMGIAVIEAAEHLADHPEEGVGHAARGVADHIIDSTE